MRPGFASILCVWLALGLSASAIAQPSESVAEQQGKAKFDAGREALKQGDVKGALTLFQASYALDETVGALLNMAYCEEKLGLSASAAKHYHAVLRLLPATDDRVPVAKERMAALEPHIPTLRIRLDKGAPSGATVFLGGRELPPYTLDTDMRLDPGTYTITVSAVGSTTKRYEVILADGKKETLVVSPIPEPFSTGTSPPVASGAPVAASASPTATVPPPSSAAAPAPSPLRTAGFVTLGVGGAALIAGAVTGGLAVATRQQLEHDCPGSGTRECDPALRSLHADGKTYADASTATLAIAGAALAGGVVMVILARRAATTTSRVGLAVGPGTITVQGRF